MDEGWGGPLALRLCPLLVSPTVDASLGGPVVYSLPRPPSAKRSSTRERIAAMFSNASV